MSARVFSVFSMYYYYLFPFLETVTQQDKSTQLAKICLGDLVLTSSVVPAPLSVLLVLWTSENFLSVIIVPQDSGFSVTMH